VLFQCQVVTGRRYVLKHDERDLESAPEGYDSVHGEPHGVYDDETVVYHDEAAIVRYMFILDAPNLS